MIRRLLRLALFALPLAFLWVRIRLRPAILRRLAAWDQRAIDHAVARGGTVAARAHLERAWGRLDPAIALVRPRQA